MSKTKGKVEGDRRLKMQDQVRQLIYARSNKSRIVQRLKER